MPRQPRVRLALEGGPWNDSRLENTTQRSILSTPWRQTRQKSSAAANNGWEKEIAKQRNIIEITISCRHLMKLDPAFPALYKRQEAEWDLPVCRRMKKNKNNPTDSMSLVKYAQSLHFNRLEWFYVLMDDYITLSMQWIHPHHMLFLCSRFLSSFQRMLGFAICFGSGYLITFLSFSFFIQLMEGE